MKELVRFTCIVFGTRKTWHGIRVNNQSVQNVNTAFPIYSSFFADIFKYIYMKKAEQL